MISQMIETPLANFEAEANVIGSILNDSSTFEQLKLKAEHFALPAHQVIFEVLDEMNRNEAPIDMITLTNELSKKQLLNQVGGVSLLSQITRNTITTHNIKFHEKILFEKHNYRKIQAFARELLTVANEQRDFGEVGEIIDKLQNLDTQGETKRRSINEVLIDVYDDIEKRSVSKQDVTGIQTGYRDFDRILNGLQVTELAILAARPSIGKTAFALNLSTGISQHNVDVIPVIYSLETPDSKLVERQLVAEANLDAQRIRTGNVGESDWQRITMGMGRLSRTRQYYHDLSHCTPNYIREDLKALKRLHPGEKLVAIIDHLQLMSGNTREQNRNLEVGAITRDLKRIAKELGVAIILLSQLSRGVESRADKRPNMSDLRDSGEVEQNADTIGFLYRDDYYDKQSEAQNIVEVIIAKQRNGPTGTVELAFMREYNKFVSIERRHGE